MRSGPKIVLLTGNARRHRYAARQLAAASKVVGVVSETGRPVVAAPELLPAADQVVIERHFVERDEVERALLGEDLNYPHTDVLEIAGGTVNSPEVFEWVQAREPDLLVLYGSGLIKAPLLDVYDRRIINLHLGLSPYYRGSGTNFWPLVERKPECVGATIHLAVRDVDAGAILAQVRPPAETADRAHELGTKTIMAAMEIMPRVVSLYAEDRIQAHPQDLSQGQVYRNRDFNADAVRAMWRNFETGMMAEYTSDRERRCRQYPVCALPDDEGTQK